MSSAVVVDRLVARVKLSEGDPAESRGQLAAKAKEYVRRIGVRSSQGVGEAEICKPAICLELAAEALGLQAQRGQFQLMSGVPQKIYQRHFLMIQKLLGLNSRVTARQLVEKFGCVRMEQSVERTLKAFKERYVQALPAAERAYADFGRPVFITAVFWLLVKKNKVPRVEKADILRLAVADEAEFGRVVNSVSELCFDHVGVAKIKKSASDVKQNRELLDRCTGAGNAEEMGRLDPTALSAKDQSREEAQRWRDKVLAEIKNRKSGAGKDASEMPPAKRTKQATLSFAPKPSCV